MKGEPYPRLQQAIDEGRIDGSHKPDPRNRSSRNEPSMRDLTEKEMHSLMKEGLCPFCRGDQFYEGPQGGLSTNIFCANEACKAGFNLPPLNIPFTGQLIREPIHDG